MSTSAVPARTLARVVKIAAISPIEGADAIDVASVLGYECVVAKKDGFTVGQLALYFSIGAILEHSDDTAFLDRKRIKIRKLRGQVSEGLIAPLSWVQPFGLNPADLVEDQDLTSIMRVQVYVPAEELTNQSGPCTGLGPGLIGSLIPKTDEQRIQESPTTLARMASRKVVVTVKMDGCSVTYAYVNDVVRTYSRNLDVTDSVASRAYAQYHQYRLAMQLDDRLVKYCHQSTPPLQIALQGELCGHNINSGRTGATRLEMHVFNVWDILAQSYWHWDRVVEACAEMGLQHAPVKWAGPNVGFPPEAGWDMSAADLDAHAREVVKRFVSWADCTNYTRTLPAEGLVCKTDDDEGPRRSFKVIAPRYLLRLEKRNGD